MNIKAYTVVLIICILLFAIPLDIASIVIGVHDPGDCDAADQMGLDAAQYVLGLGISGLITGIVVVITMIGLILEVCVALNAAVLLVTSLLAGLFGLAWFIVGAVILFRANIECINHGSACVVYGLVLWILTAFQCFRNCKISCKTEEQA